jgi:hypothetical protein
MRKPTNRRIWNVPAIGVDKRGQPGTENRRRQPKPVVKRAQQPGSYSARGNLPRIETCARKEGRRL